MRLEHSTRLLVLRHGQTDWNAQQRFQGRADVPLNDVLRFERELLDYLRHESSVLKTIGETLVFDDDTAAATREAIDRFKRQFRTSEGKILITDNTVHTPVAKEDIHQEEIVAGGKAH